jgi:hypothetical protein
MCFNPGKRNSREQQREGKNGRTRWGFGRREANRDRKICIEKKREEAKTEGKKKKPGKI